MEYSPTPLRAVLTAPWSPNEGSRTKTAAEFFARQGYQVIERSAAPQDMQGSEEFRSLCPSSATCMAKNLPDSP